MEENQQELMFKLSMFEQQTQQLQQQLQAVEQAIIDMNTLNFGLDELTGSEGKEIIAPVGRGIFVKTKLLSEEMIVDVGGKNFVKKSIPETKKIIDKQIKKLEDIQKELNDNMEMLGGEILGMINQAEGKNKN